MKIKLKETQKVSKAIVLLDQRFRNAISSTPLMIEQRTESSDKFIDLYVIDTQS